MSGVLTRPGGDYIASIYGDYYTPTKLASLKKGDKLEVLEK